MRDHRRVCDMTMMQAGVESGGHIWQTSAECKLVNL